MDFDTVFGSIPDTAFAYDFIALPIDCGLKLSIPLVSNPFRLEMSVFSLFAADTDTLTADVSIPETSSLNFAIAFAILYATPSAPGPPVPIPVNVETPLVSISAIEVIRYLIR